MENKLYRLVFLTAIIFFAVGVQAQRRNARYVEYINKYSDLAVEQMKLHKIPASITLAHGLLESVFSLIFDFQNESFCITEWLAIDMQLCLFFIQYCPSTSE